MKKSLLALARAVLSAALSVVAGAASSQSNVTIYGVADVGITRAKTLGATGSSWALTSGNQSGSRVGIKGQEDLGGGVAATFRLEGGFDLSNGATDETRETTVGLQGGFGAVKLGRQYTPIRTTVDAIDPFATGLAGSMTQTFNTFGKYMNDSVSYALPRNLGGLYGEAAYAFGERSGSRKANSQFGLTVGYASGPLNAVLSYHKQENPTGTGSGQTTFLGATYDLRVVKVHAAVARNEGDAVLGGLNTTGGKEVGITDPLFFDIQDKIGFAETVKTRDYMLGASAPVGAAGTVLASFLRKDVINDETVADVWAIGYAHRLSTRTNLYTSYGLTKMHADYSDTIGDFDFKANQFDVGLRHTF